MPSKRFRWFQGVSFCLLTHDKRVDCTSSLSPNCQTTSVKTELWMYTKPLDVHGAFANLMQSEHIHLLCVGNFSNNPTTTANPPSPYPPPHPLSCLWWCVSSALTEATPLPGAAPSMTLTMTLTESAATSSISATCQYFPFVLLGTVFQLAPSDCRTVFLEALLFLFSFSPFLNHPRYTGSMQIFLRSVVVIIVILQAVDLPSRILHVIAERRAALTD